MVGDDSQTVVRGATVASRRLTILAAAAAVGLVALALAVPAPAPATRARAKASRVEVSRVEEPRVEAPRDPEARAADNGIHVEVVDLAGAPVEEASVRAEVEYAVAEVVTDAHGRATMPRLAGGLYRARKPGYIVAWRHVSEERALRFVLEPGAPVDGRVLFTDGTPAGGCEVRAWDPERRADTAEYFPLDDAHFTDALGRFQIAGSDPCHPLGIRASLPGYASVVVMREPADAPEPVVITLGGGGAIEGFVLDDVGHPRAGVEVAVMEGGDGSPFHLLARSAIAETTSDSSGHYRLLGLQAPAAYMVYAREGSLLGRAGAALAELGQVSRADLTLQALGGIDVKVVSGDGKPVPRPRVEIVRRDADGESKLDDYSLDPHLLPIPHEVRVFAYGYLPASVIVDVEPGRVVEKEVVLERGRKVWVRTLDEAGGSVEGHVSLEWRDASPGLGRSAALSSPEHGWCAVRWPGVGQATLRVEARGFLDAAREIAATDDEVRIVLRRMPHVIFRLPAPASDAFDLASEHHATRDPEGRFLMPVHEGATRIRVRADQKDYASGEIRVRPGETTDIGMLEPLRRGTLAGRVLGPTGAPLVRAVVEAPFFGQTLTDRSGRFRLDRAPVMATTLRIEAKGHPQVWEPVEPGEDVTVRVPAGGEVCGRVLDADGEPVPGWFQFHAARDDGSIDKALSWHAQADSLGKFRLLLPPGRFRASPRAPGTHRDVALGPVVQVDAGEIEEIEVRLPWSLKLWR